MSRITLFLDRNLEAQVDEAAYLDELPTHYEIMKILRIFFKEHETERKIRLGMQALSMPILRNPSNY